MIKVKFIKDYGTHKKNDEDIINNRLAARLFAKKIAKAVKEKLTQAELKKADEFVNKARAKAKEEIQKPEFIAKIKEEVKAELSDADLKDIRNEVKAELMASKDFIAECKAELKATLKLK